LYGQNHMNIMLGKYTEFKRASQWFNLNLLVQIKYLNLFYINSRTFLFIWTFCSGLFSYRYWKKLRRWNLQEGQILLNIFCNKRNNLNIKVKIYWSEQSFTGLGPKDRYSSWGLVVLCGRRVLISDGNPVYVLQFVS
jgi:hypothetical protein